MHDAVTHRLSFGTPERGGEILLFDNATVQVRFSDGLRSEMIVERYHMGESALFWGASLLLGLGTLGAVLRYNRYEKTAWGAFAAAGTSGLIAAGVRWMAVYGEGILQSRFPLSNCMISQGVDGGIVLALQNRAFTALSLRLKADEFDANVARTFLSAVESART